MSSTAAAAAPNTSSSAGATNNGSLDVEAATNTNANATNYVNMSDMPKSDVSNPAAASGAAAASEEEADDAHADAATIVSSVLTAEGIHDTTGFSVVCLVILIGDMCRGIFFPSMWPLVETLGGTHVTLGYAVAAYSFGRILVNPLFGSWSHTVGYSTTLTIAMSILLFGTLLYAAVVPVGRPEFLIVAQTVMGVGSGTLGVTRAFVADVTAQRQRTTYMAWITAVQYAGFTVTPLVGAAFNFFFAHVGNAVDGSPAVFHLFGFLPLTMFTAPAYFMTMVSAGALVVLVTKFRDRQRIHIVKQQPSGGIHRKSTKRLAIDMEATRTTVIGLTVYDCCILGCMLLNISTKGSIASFETLGIVVAQEEFGFTSQKAGLIVGLCGAMGVVALLSMGHFARHLTDVQLIGGGMCIMAAGVALLLTVPPHEIEQDYNNVQPDRHAPLWKYVVSIFLIYAIGYPIGHTAVIGLFSKIVGRRPQGTLLGWFASAGSLARMIFPVMSGYIAAYLNVSALFAILITVLVVSSVFVAWSRHTLTMLSS